MLAPTSRATLSHDNGFFGGRVPHKKLQAAIARYAAAYAELEELQHTANWMPGGDQKTGSIGEYYACVYLASLHGKGQLTFGGRSEKGWDIKVNCQQPYRVQIKTVSAYSKTRTISPIHKGWDQLFVVYLNKVLAPEGFWIIDDTDIFDGQEVLASMKCCVPGTAKMGSSRLKFGPNRIDDLRAAIDMTLNAPLDVG